MIRSALACAFIVVGLACVPGVARAEERYEALFKDGRAAMDVHDYDRACQLFKESLDIGAPVGALLNLADCEDKRGHPARALTLWREGLGKLPSTDPRRDLAKRQLEDVDQRVGKVSVVWPSAPKDTKSFVDGRAVKLGGDPEAVDPGPHKVTVTSSEGTRTIDVTVASGELKSVDVGPTGTVAPARGHGMLIGGALSVALGGAGVIGAAITGAVYLDAKSTLNKNCPVRSRCTDPDGISASQRGRAAGAANIAMFVLAAVGTGVGVPLLVLDATKKDGTSTPTASLVWTGAGGAVVGRF